MGCWIGSNLCAGGGGGTPGNRHHSKFCEPPSHYMHSSTHEHGHQQRTETWLPWGASAERLSGPCSTTKLWWPEAISAKAGLNIKQELKKKTEQRHEWPLTLGESPPKAATTCRLNITCDRHWETRDETGPRGPHTRERSRQRKLPWENQVLKWAKTAKQPL